MKLIAKHHLTTIFVITIISIFFIQNLIFSQEDVDAVAIGQYRKIFSKVLNEERAILVSLPSGYDRTQKEYPVLYLTDGEEYNFIRSVGIIQYFSYYRIPEMIVVGIPNTDRGRDLSPFEREQLPNSGHADNFLTFITDELIPFVDQNYRTTGYRILVGASLGGQFTIYALLSKPEYFEAYIAASPPLGIEYNVMSDKAKSLFNRHETLNKVLFIPYTKTDFTIITSYVPKFEALIKAEAPKDFKFEVKEYDGMGHIPYAALLDGLIYLFSNWEPIRYPDIIPSGGVFPEGKSIFVELHGENNSIRYTLDGKEPTRKSSLYNKPIAIKKSATIKAKAFRDNLTESGTVSAKYKNAPMRPAEKNLSYSDLEKGLIYKYYERYWLDFPNSIDIEPVRTGIAQSINLHHRLRDEGFIFQFDGCIDIKKNGAYRFHLLNNSESKLFIGKELIIHCKNYISVRETSYEINLEAGKHPIKLIYNNCWNPRQILEVKYEGPGIKKQEIPAKHLYHKKN